MGLAARKVGHWRVQCCPVAWVISPSNLSMQIVGFVPVTTITLSISPELTCFCELVGGRPTANFPCPHSPAQALGVPIPKPTHFKYKLSVVPGPLQNEVVLLNSSIYDIHPIMYPILSVYLTRGIPKVKRCTFPLSAVKLTGKIWP